MTQFSGSLLRISNIQFYVSIIFYVFLLSSLSFSFLFHTKNVLICTKISYLILLETNDIKYPIENFLRLFGPQNFNINAQPYLPPGIAHSISLFYNNFLYIFSDFYFTLEFSIELIQFFDFDLLKNFSINFKNSI